MIGSVLAYKGTAMIQSYRFSSNVKALEHKLHALKTMSIVYDADVEVTCKFEEGVLTVSSFTHERFPLLHKDLTLRCDSITPELSSFIIKPTSAIQYSLIIALDQRQIKIKI